MGSATTENSGDWVPQEANSVMKISMLEIYWGVLLGPAPGEGKEKEVHEKEIWAEGKAGLQGGLGKDVMRSYKAGIAVQRCSGLGQGGLTDQSLDVGWPGKKLWPWVRHLSPAQAVPGLSCSHTPRSKGNGASALIGGWSGTSELHHSPSPVLD